METEIIVAILAFIGTIAGSYFSNNKNTAVMKEQIKGVKEDITTLSKRVNKHSKIDSPVALYKGDDYKELIRTLFMEGDNK